MKLYKSYIASQAVIPEHNVGQLLETIWRVEKLTVEMALPKYGADKRRKASEYLSNSVAWLWKMVH